MPCATASLSWKPRRPASVGPISTGCKALDALLPGGGFHRGTLVEWIASTEAAGAETLAVLAASEACREGGVLVVFDRGEFYPPEAMRLGIDSDNLIVVQAASAADHLWALDQALRSPAVAAALAWPETLDPRTFRRLQLAAEEGGSLGFLAPPAARPRRAFLGRCASGHRPAPAGRGPARGMVVELIRGRGGADGGSIELEFNDETHTLHLASPLADPADRRRAAGA